MEKKYLFFYKMLREQIIDGIYPFGTKLPSKRVFAADHNISVITVERTYNILCDEGYIEARARSGYYVIYREADSFFSVEERLITKEKLPENEESTFPFSVLARTARSVIAQYGERLLAKGPGEGCPALRAEICAYLGRNRGITVREEQIIIGAGAEYLYDLAVKILGADKIYATESPSYEKIRQVYLSCGVKCVSMRLGKNGILSEDLRKTEADVLHITPYRSFPSGVTADISKRREYIHWARQKNRYIVEDDYLSEFSVSSKTEDTVFSMAGDRVIYINTFSQTISSAFRIAYMVLPESLLPMYHRNADFLNCSVSMLDQYLVAALIGQGDFERHINKVRRNKRKKLK